MKRSVASVWTVFAASLAGILVYRASLRPSTPRARAPEEQLSAQRTVASLHSSQPPLARRGADLQRALANIRERLQGEPRRAALLAWLIELAPADGLLALQLAASLSEEEGGAPRMFAHALSSAPEAARSWLLSHVKDLPPEIAAQLARDLAQHDPPLGVAVAEQMYVATRGPAMRAVFGVWAARDPQAASQAVERLDNVDGHLSAVE